MSGSVVAVLRQWRCEAGRSRLVAMYVTELIIYDIRSIQRFSLSLPLERCAGWHVVLGDNGAGKSTFVRALAVALAGPGEAKALRQDFSTWLRSGAGEGRISLSISAQPELDKLSGRGRRVLNNHFRGDVILARLKTGWGFAVEVSGGSANPPLSRGPWGHGAGWFSASFGPYRRFSGGNRDYERLFLTNPRLAPHLSAFGEDVALTECLEWLRALHVRDLEAPDGAGLLSGLVAFINGSDLLPHGTVLQSVTSQDVIFRDGNGNPIPIEQLSDGYRSILSMTFELIRQMVTVYGPEPVMRRIREGVMEVDLPGVVAIDEVDAHLHPAWQRRIGPWFLRVFPKLQFFVTTHSPIICQAAERGTVWRLPTPGSGEEGGQVEGEALHRLVLGNVLEAYDTTFFGEGVARSDTSRERLLELAKLNRKKLTSGLSDGEQAKLDDLRAAMPTTATVAERTGLPVE